MFGWLLRRHKVTPGLEKQVSLLRTSHEVLEQKVRQHELDHEETLHRILEMLAGIDGEIKADRAAAAQLGPLYAGEVIKGFKDTAVEILELVTERDRAANETLTGKVRTLEALTDQVQVLSGVLDALLVRVEKLEARPS